MLLLSTFFVVASGCSDPTAPASPTANLEVSPTVVRPAVFIPSLVTARSADDVVNSIGANVHLSYFQTPYGTAWESVVKPKIIGLGIRHLRDGGVVKTDNKWMEIVYGRMKELSAKGVKFNLIMRPAEGTAIYDRVDQFDRLMQYAGPAVDAFEGLNEHDLSKRPNWMAEVQSFQRSLFNRVKGDAKYRDLPVYGPSIGHPGNGAQLPSLASWMDLASIHPYPGGLQPMNNLVDHKNKLKNISGPRPFVVTETGYHTSLTWTGGHPGVSEDAMARYVPRMVLEYFDAGIARTYFYEFIDQGTNKADREQNFGLLRYNGTEKPAYTALKNLIGLLSDAGPAFTPGKLSFAVSGDPTVRQMLLQKRDGRFYLVLWQPVASFDLLTKRALTPATSPVTVEFADKMAKVSVYSPLTSPTASETRASVSSIAVTVPDSPIVLEIKP